MIKVRDEKDQANIAKVYRAGQEHIFRFWEEIGPDERKRLLRQIERLDWQLLARLLKKIGEPQQLHRLEPPTGVIRLARTDAERLRAARARNAGEEALRAGRVCGLTVAGGQGTRLGFEGPKGCVPIGPLSSKTLFQLFAEKIQATAQRYRVKFPWYVMGSEGNLDEIVSAFQSHNYFGVGRAEVFFFAQKELPCLDLHGKLILAEKGRIATSPNGHGGVIPALKESGALEDMARRGVDLISYWQIDNPLVPVADPVFLGYLIQEDAEAAAKVASKRDPHERVGVWGLVDGVVGTIEYTELSKEDAERRREDGRLVFDAGNLAIHAFRRGFIERLNESGAKLCYHKVLKKVRFVDRKGNPVEPEEPNGIKFETFVFDAMREARKVVLMEVDRRSEFAPVKNATGEDSLETARQALSNLFGRWIEKAGGKVPRDAAGNVTVPIEISPLYALDEEEYCQKGERDLEVIGPLKL